MAIRVTPNCEQIPLNIVGSSTFGDYPKISLEKTYNLFESDGFLVPYPGWHKVLIPLASGVEGRGLFRSFRGNRMIAVVDSIVYDIGPTLSALAVGILATSAGEVFMDENLVGQICIVDGVNAYIYNYNEQTSGVVLQTGGALSGTPPNLIPNYVTYHNTFFLIGNSPNSNSSSNWYAYEYASSTTISENSEMSIETKPDSALAIKRIPGQAGNVLVFGGAVCEIFTQVPIVGAGGVPQAYQRNSSISVDYGCESVSTIAESDTHIAWLGVNEANLPVIMVMTGQQTGRISTDGIDFFLQNIKSPTNSTAMMYRINGHLFYHLSFLDPQDNVTLLYDFNVEKFYHSCDQFLNYHPARQLVFFNADTKYNPALDGIPQNIFFISRKGGYIYQLSQQFTDINEDINSDLAAGTDPNLRYEMQRIRICKSIRFPTSAPFKANQLCFTIMMGTDNIEAVQDCIVLMITENNIRMFSEDPSYRQLVPEHAGQEDCAAVPYQGRIDLAIAKNGDDTFSNYVPRYMHHTGYGKNILRWNKMGKANDLVPKIRFWTLGPIACTDGYVEVTT